MKLPAATSKKAEVLTKHICEESKRAPKMVAQVLRTWMTESSH